MKSTPRNLMAGMNVSRDQKVGRVHQLAKGLPQDGAPAGGQTYDSSKRRETTSNHQTTSSKRPSMPTRANKSSMHFKTMAQADVPQGRNGKHKQVVTTIL